VGQQKQRDFGEAFVEAISQYTASAADLKIPTQIPSPADCVPEHCASDLPKRRVVNKKPSLWEGRPLRAGEGLDSKSPTPHLLPQRAAAILPQVAAVSVDVHHGLEAHTRLPYHHPGVRQHRPFAHASLVVAQQDW
jgi:hypothetical protein